MKKYLSGTVTGACLLVVFQTAQATSIDVSAESPGVLWPSLPSATVLTFDDLPVGSLPSYQFSGGTLSGSGAIEDSSVVGKYAQPAADDTATAEAHFDFGHTATAPLAPLPFPPPAAVMVQQLLLWKAILAEESEAPAALYRLHVLEVSSLEVTAHRVFVDPECRACGGLS